MEWRADRLPELVRAMAARPRHEALRGHVTELLREAFGAAYDEIGHEVQLSDRTGRIDTMWGPTVIKLKSDLRREMDDVQARLPAYLADAQARSADQRPVTGIATVGRALRRIRDSSEADIGALAGTFAQLQALYRAGRNGIWTFVLRNLVRPVWLSRADQGADVLVGNPPWIVYRHPSPEMKERVRDALRVYGLWVGGNLATQQDIFALFWARGAERYFRQGGRIGFVLPYAVLNAPVFAALRAGFLGPVSVRVVAGWALERVWPIFGAQSGSSTTSICVLFGVREVPGAVPPTIARWVGHLPRRDADEREAKQALTRKLEAWPRPRTLIGASPYRERFPNGATLSPRRFFVVDPEPTSRLGVRKDAPLMRVKIGAFKFLGTRSIRQKVRQRLSFLGLYTKARASFRFECLTL